MMARSPATMRVSSPSSSACSASTGIDVSSANCPRRSVTLAARLPGGTSAVPLRRNSTRPSSITGAESSSIARCRSSSSGAASALAPVAKSPSASSNATQAVAARRAGSARRDGILFLGMMALTGGKGLQPI